MNVKVMPKTPDVVIELTSGDVQELADELDHLSSSIGQSWSLYRLRDLLEGAVEEIESR